MRLANPVCHHVGEPVVGETDRQKTSGSLKGEKGYPTEWETSSLGLIPEAAIASATLTREGRPQVQG